MPIGMLRYLPKFSISAHNIIQRLNDKIAARQKKFRD
jgi:hypothetical protein